MFLSKHTKKHSAYLSLNPSMENSKMCWKSGKVSEVFVNLRYVVVKQWYSADALLERMLFIFLQKN